MDYKQLDKDIAKQEKDKQNKELLKKLIDNTTKKQTKQNNPSKPQNELVGMWKRTPKATKSIFIFMFGIIASFMVAYSTAPTQFSLLIWLNNLLPWKWGTIIGQFRNNDDYGLGFGLISILVFYGFMTIDIIYMYIHTRGAYKRELFIVGQLHLHKELPKNECLAKVLELTQQNKELVSYETKYLVAEIERLYKQHILVIPIIEKQEPEQIQQISDIVKDELIGNKKEQE